MELLVVIALLSMLATGIAMAVYDQWIIDRIDHADTSAKELRRSVAAYWLAHPETKCPTLQALMSAGVVDEDASENDPWGSPWLITCDGDRVQVSSPGPDREPDTEDDIRAPKRRSSRAADG